MVADFKKNTEVFNVNVQNIQRSPFFWAFVRLDDQIKYIKANYSECSLYYAFINTLPELKKIFIQRLQIEESKRVWGIYSEIDDICDFINRCLNDELLSTVEKFKELNIFLNTFIKNNKKNIEEN